MKRKQNLFSLLGGVHNRVYAPVFFILVMILCMSVKSWAASVYLVPDVTVQSTLTTVGASTRIDAIDDYPVVWSPETYLYTTTTESLSYFSLTDPSVTEGEIEKIVVHAWVEKMTSGLGYYYIGVNTEGDNDVVGDTQLMPNNGPDERTLEIINNPDDNQQWQWSDLDGLNIVIDLLSSDSNRAAVHSMSVEVVYNEIGQSGEQTPVYYQTGKPVFVSDWTGVYTTDFETYRSQSLVYPWGSDGPAVFISKKDFITMTGFFGAILAGIITWVLFRAVV